MEKVCAPTRIGASGNLGGGEAEASEAKVVVAKITLGVAVGSPVALVEVGAQEHVDQQAVAHLDEPEVARRHAGLTGKPRHDGDMVEPVDHLPVTGNQDPDVVVSA